VIEKVRIAGVAVWKYEVASVVPSAGTHQPHKIVELLYSAVWRTLLNQSVLERRQVKGEVIGEFGSDERSAGGCF